MNEQELKEKISEASKDIKPLVDVIVNALCEAHIDICDYYGDFYDYTGENVTRNVTHWMPLPMPPQGKEEKK